MLMSWIFAGSVAVSLICAFLSDKGALLSSAAVTGAQSGVQLAIALAGSICLWSGVGKLMEKAGLTAILSHFLSPLLHFLFPSCKADPVLAGDLSANICANLLGLGNAATPMGIRAARRLTRYGSPGVAGDELCRLIVLNTASIQLIPANVAAIRAGLGTTAPFDILPAVWITSLCAAGTGICCAFSLGKLWKHD